MSCIGKCYRYGAVEWQVYIIHPFFCYPERYSKLLCYAIGPHTNPNAATFRPNYVSNTAWWPPADFGQERTTHHTGERLNAPARLLTGVYIIASCISGGIAGLAPANTSSKPIFSLTTCTSTPFVFAVAGTRFSFC